MRLFSAFLLCFGLLVPFAYTQVTPDKFAKESAVVERFDTVITMQADGTGTVERTLAVRIQSEATLRDLGVLNIAFASASEHVDIKYVRVRRPDGTVTETAVTAALEQPTPVTREAPFYSDQKVKQLPIRSLHVGDTLEWQAVTVRTRAEAPNEFWGEHSFNDTLVTLEESLELHVPLASPVHVWTNPQEVKPTETSTAAERVYRWQHTYLKPTVGKEAEAAAELKKKTVLSAAEQLDERLGKLPGQAWSTYPSWAAVGEWYRALEQGRMTADADVKAKVAEVTAGKTTQEAKVRAVYDYASLQIRYIGVAFGIGRYQPHPASDVLTNQYGDCKDKHTLLAAMLTELGLHPKAVLIGQGIRFNEALPSPGVFNHLLTQVEVDGKPVWLDATEEVAPYGMLMLPLRDEQALVIPESGEPKLERTPSDPPFASVQTMTAVGTLDKEGTSVSRITLAVRGDQELLIRAVMRQVPPAKYPEVIQSLSEGMGYAGTASNPDFGSPEDTSQPYRWSYDYKREKGGDWEHFRIIPQLAYRSLPTLDAKQPPIEDVDLGAPRTEVSSAEMKLPQGWSAELPEATHAAAPFATFDETFRLANGTVYADEKVVVLKRFVPVADWKSCQKFVDQAGLDNQVYIQLTHTGAPPAKAAKPGAAAAGTPPPAEALRLLRAAQEAYTRKDMALATTLADQVRALDAGAKGLWGLSGAIAGAKGKNEEAIADYRKELALHDDAVWVYPNMAHAQQRMGKQDDAMDTLRAWSAARPAEARPVVQLMALLTEANKADEALKVAADAMKTVTDSGRNDALQLEFGRAQLKAGQAEAGTATMIALIHRDNSTPSDLNSAAYALADGKLELPLSEATERGVLTQLDQETRTWTGNEAPAVLAAKSSLLCSSWDTMGWILYREGKPVDAEQYVGAAFLNQPNPEIGQHLGDLRLANGDAAGARKAYQMALATIPARYGSVQTASSKIVRDALQARLDGVKKAGADPAVDLTELRKVRLGPANGHSGSAEYRIVLSAKGVESAGPAGDKTVPGGSELIKSMKVPHLFPKDSQARLVKLAILNCHADTCEVIFEP